MHAIPDGTGANGFWMRVRLAHAAIARGSVPPGGWQRNVKVRTGDPGWFESGLRRIVRLVVPRGACAPGRYTNSQSLETESTR